MPHDRSSPGNRSLLDAIEAAFQQLGTRAAYTIDGAAIGNGLPARPLALPELRAVLLSPATSHAARDAAIRLLWTRARRSQDWRLALTGMLLPGLRRIANQLRGRSPMGLDDLEAELIAGLHTAISRNPIAVRRVAAGLLWAAFRAALDSIHAERRQRARRAVHVSLDQLPVPPETVHPDLLLAAAVRAGVLRPSEAEVIAASRVERVSLHHLAGQWGVPYQTVVKHRQRAERRLRAWLVASWMSPAVPDAAPASAARRSRARSCGCVAAAGRRCTAHQRFAPSPSRREGR